MISKMFVIPIANYEAAVALQREITGIPDDPPMWDLGVARGASRANCYLCAHGGLWTDTQTNELASRIGEVGGTVTDSATIADVKTASARVRAVGNIRRPDLDPLPVEEVEEIVDGELLPIDKNGKTKAQIIDAAEDHLNSLEPS